MDHLINRYLPNAKTILDLGCGTGRHAFHLADKGYAVTGVDHSDDMLSVAKDQASSFGRPEYNSPSFLSGDIREVRLGQTFDVIVSLFHVMSYQSTNEDLQKTFETASVHLEPNGIFIFDCWYGPGVLADKPKTRVKELEDDTLTITRTAEPIMHPHENWVDVNYHVLIRDKASDQMDELKECHRMRYLFQPEVKLFLVGSKFELVAFLEFLQDTPPGPEEWNVCFITRKKGKSFK